MAEAIAGVKDDIIRPIGVTAYASGNEIQHQVMSRLPSDHMIAAGGVATDTTNSSSIGAVKSEAATENIDSADVFTNHGIMSHAETIAGAGVGNL